MADRTYSTRPVPAYSTPAYSASWAKPPEPLVPMRAPAPKRVSFWADLGNGLVLGDFAPEMRLGGATMQIICSFIPGVGTLCALRDGTADLQHRDLLGFFLNMLALIPVFGGFAKTLHVILELWHARHMARRRRTRAAQPQHVYYVPVSAVPTQRLPPPAQPRQPPRTRPRR